MPFLLPSMAALAALLILPGWSFYFEVTPKVAVILLAAAAAIPMIRWPKGKRSQWVMVLIAIQAVGIMAAAFFSIDRWTSFYGSTWRKSGVLAELAVLAIVAAGQFSDPDRLRTWLRITVAASIPISIYAVFQYFGVDPIFPPNAYHFGEGRYMIVRPPSTL